MTVNGGKFELYSGTITGGLQVGMKGGSYQTGSAFTMYGGAITGNEESSGAGGGVFLVGTTNHIDPPSFTMHGGTISDNTAGASDGGGGGVYVGEVQLHHGRRSHHRQPTAAGSISTLTPAEFRSPTPRSPATRRPPREYKLWPRGGIYSQRGVTVKNVTITGNNSTFEGGGIYGKGAITLTDATVADNKRL